MEMREGTETREGGEGQRRKRQQARRSGSGSVAVETPRSPDPLTSSVDDVVPH